jgi:hypothetical protein
VNSEKLERQIPTEDALLQFFDDDGRRSILKNYIYLELINSINTLEEQNDRIHEALATVILNMTGRGKFNKTSSPIPSDER